MVLSSLFCKRSKKKERIPDLWLVGREQENISSRVFLFLARSLTSSSECKSNVQGRQGGLDTTNKRIGLDHITAFKPLKVFARKNLSKSERTKKWNSHAHRNLRDLVSVLSLILTWRHIRGSRGQHHAWSPLFLPWLQKELSYAIFTAVTVSGQIRTTSFSHGK